LAQTGFVVANETLGAGDLGTIGHAADDPDSAKAAHAFVV
jgi:hypothetical protein